MDKEHQWELLRKIYKVNEGEAPESERESFEQQWEKREKELEQLFKEKVIVVPQAGHNLYVDNPKNFVDGLAKIFF